MQVLECTKPGAKAGQVILAVDLTIAGDFEAALSEIARLGYEPEIRHFAYPTGVHVLAVLSDEMIDDDYLLEPWMELQENLNPDAVHLWRGQPARTLVAC